VSKKKCLHFWKVRMVSDILINTNVLHCTLGCEKCGVLAVGTVFVDRIIPEAVGLK